MLGEEMYSLLLNYPPKTLNRILRNMFMDCYYQNLKTGVPENYEEEICALQALFDLLDKAEDEWVPIITCQVGHTL